MIRRALAMMVLGAMFPFVAAGVASAQVCSPPECPASVAPPASSPGVVAVSGKVSGAEDSVLGRSDRSTTIPFLSVYAGLSILGFTLAAIAVRRRAAPVNPITPAVPAARSRKPTDNTEWAAQILARRMERLEKTSSAL